jgi:hypothetical protein
MSFALALAACTTTPDHTTMTGTNAFTAASTVMVPKGLHCSTSGVVTSGKLDALTVVVADVDLNSTGCPGLDFDILPHVLQLQVATGGYFAADPNAANQPITAGMTFPILNENVSDENLCGNVPAGTNQPTGIAILNQCAAGSSCKNYFASTGSITVSDVSSASVNGTFDLTLINADHEPQGTLSGSFDATTCP